MTPEEELAAYKLRFARARITLTRWVNANRLTVADVARIFSGDYYYYVTFMKTVTARGAQRRGYVVVKADSLDEADRIAYAKYGDLVRDVFPEYEFDPGNFPKGEVGSIGFVQEREAEAGEKKEEEPANS